MIDPEHPDRRDEDPGSQDPQRPARQQPSEIHREREIIVTGGGRGSGSSTAIVVIFAILALGVLAFVAFTYFGGDDGRILPEDVDVDVDIELPAPSVPAPDGGE